MPDLPVSITVTYSAANRQLEVVPESFENLDVLPFTVDWTIAPGDVVAAGQVLGTWVWRTGERLDFRAPGTAGKRVTELLTNELLPDELPDDPPQILARFADD